MKFQETAKFGCTLLQWVKGQKNAWDEYCSLLLFVIFVLCIHWKLYSGLSLNRTRWHAVRKADQICQCSGDSSEDVAVSAIPTSTSDLPWTIVPRTTWPSLQSSSSSCHRAGKRSTHQRCGALQQRTPLHKPEVHRRFKCESGPRLLFHLLTTSRHQVALTGFPNGSSASNRQKPGHFSGAPPQAGQHYRWSKS